MKKITFAFIIFLVCDTLIHSQTYNAYFSTHQQPPRAEAMGRLHTGLEGDINSILYNPLTVAYLDDLQWSIYTSSPDAFSTDSRLNFISLGTNVNNWFKIGLAYHFQLRKYYNQDEIEYIPLRESTTLSLGFKPSKNFAIGLSSNFIYSRSIIDNFFGNIDFGIFEKNLENHFGVSSKHYLKNNRHFMTATFRASYNYYFENQSAKIPKSVPITLGTSFHLMPQKMVLNKYRLFKLISSLELYRNMSGVLYRRKRTLFFRASVGNELTFLDFLSLRLGYVFWNVQFPNNDQVNPKRSGFTYGLGFKIPIHPFLNQKRPLHFYLDYCYLPQHYYNNIRINSPDRVEHNFQSISIRMSVGLKHLEKNKSKNDQNIDLIK